MCVDGEHPFGRLCAPVLFRQKLLIRHSKNVLAFCVLVVTAIPGFCCGSPTNANPTQPRALCLEEDTEGTATALPLYTV